jgi:predicted permease
MQAQEKARDLIQERKPWWQHPLVAFMLPMFAGLVLGLIFAILGYQFGTNFADAVTPAAQAASSGVAERLAETVAGGPPQ